MTLGLTRHVSVRDYPSLILEPLLQRPRNFFLVHPERSCRADSEMMMVRLYVSGSGIESVEGGREWQIEM